MVHRYSNSEVDHAVASCANDNNYNNYNISVIVRKYR